jgi:hypothetical protein
MWGCVYEMWYSSSFLLISLLHVVPGNGQSFRCLLEQIIFFWNGQGWKEKPEWQAESKYESGQPRGGASWSIIHYKADQFQATLLQPGKKGRALTPPWASAALPLTSAFPPFFSSRAIHALLPLPVPLSEAVTVVQIQFFALACMLASVLW